MLRKLFFSPLCLFLVVGIAGCGDHDDHDDHNHDEHGEESHLDEACEHMADGPASSFELGAGADAATDTASTDWEHRRVDLTFGALETTAAGYIKYEVATEGDYAVFVSGEATIKINGEDPESSTVFADCESVQSYHVFELAVGEHVIEVQSETRPLHLVIEADAGHEEHHDH